MEGLGPAAFPEGAAYPGTWRYAVGIMSGTSCDGVGVALVRTRGAGVERDVELVAHRTVAYPEELRRCVFGLYPPRKFSGRTLAHAGIEVARFFADAISELLGRSGVAGPQVRCIGMHGPTIYREPPDDSNAGEGCNFEIGEPAVVAERTGVPVVADLRPAEMAAGGQGAPLSAFVDYVLFKHPSVCRAVQNLGGIANVTWLLPGAGTDELVSFDVGPGNMVIDGVVRILSGGGKQLDRDGGMAARGRVMEPLLAELMSTPYVLKPPPKTTGRELFGDEFAARVVDMGRALGACPDDIVATATRFTVEALAYNYERFLYRPCNRTADEVVLGGGGAFNPSLVAMLRKRLAPARILTHEDFGIPNDAREALTWAVLADESFMLRPANVPAASGARHQVVLGKFCFPWVEGTGEAT